MSNLKRLFELLNHEAGKVFVIDETGEVKFVILSADDYHKLKDRGDISELSEAVKTLSGEAEALNRAITEAQMEDWSALEVEENREPERVSDNESFYIEPLEER